MSGRTGAVAATAILVVLAAVGSGIASDIRSTRHNLSVSGPGTVKALSETEVCIFCHTPHNASPVAPLWNRNQPAGPHTPYSSSTGDATPGAPTGSSKLCLSCHDGTIALGSVLSLAAPIPMAGGVTTMPAGTMNLGTSLADDHPISVAYTPALVVADGQLVDPGSLNGPVRLDANGEMQCTSCHDPHDDTYGDFLVMSNSAGALCRTCHDRDYWDTASHRWSVRTWNGIPPNPWFHTPYTTVGTNACESCHNPHSAAGSERLLNYAQEEQNCLACHNGNVATSNLAVEFAKPYRHPITSTTGVHDAAENPLTAPRHVECEDCHNPHAANPASYGAPSVNGSQIGAPGVDGDGTPIPAASYAYEVCYRCHAGSVGQPGPTTPRKIVQNNVRLEFDPENPSYHPVEAAGRNPDVPSLRLPWTTGSVMYCHDCHTNNEGDFAGGTGPEGPHGSIYPRILGWRYETADNTVESPAVYALCYRCHSRASILADVSFKKHRRHIENERTPCNVCHDPHGISATQGNATNNSHLINFDTSVVQPDQNRGVIEFVDHGRFAGECSLRCHGKNHNRLSY